MSEHTPGLIVLLGSGETLPTSGKTHEYVAKRLPENGRVAILETPAGFEPNADLVAEKIKLYLEKRLQNYDLNFETVAARKKGTAFSPDNLDIVAPILKADEILLGPGSPSYGARQMRDSLALEMIRARHQLGATLFLSSSSVLAFSKKTMPVYEIYKVGEDLHWKDGADFFSLYGLPLVIIPHWNNTDGGAELDTSRCYMGQDRYAQLVEMLDEPYTLLGIDEHTSVVLDFGEQCCYVLGKGEIRIFRDDNERIFSTGESFPLAEMGAWRVPALGEGIDPDVWQQALTAEEEKVRERETAVSTPTPTDEAIDLMHQRTAARAAKDWATADKLRDQLAEMGWQVQDTAEGPELVPA